MTKENLNLRLTAGYIGGDQQNKWDRVFSNPDMAKKKNKAVNCNGNSSSTLNLWSVFIFCLRPSFWGLASLCVLKHCNTFKVLSKIYSSAYFCQKSSHYNIKSHCKKCFFLWFGDICLERKFSSSSGFFFNFFFFLHFFMFMKGYGVILT